jgi:2-haloacid dehalogenase
MATGCVVFDAYGTLFDVASAARALASEPGQGAFARHADRLSADWRRKQLEYTWLRAVTGDQADFHQVTADGLDWALDAAGLSGDDGLRDRLMDLYLRLSPYPEVPATLSALRARGHRLAILSNGTPAMLAAAVGSAGLDGLFEAVLSVEAVGVFKPHPSVYALVEQTLGVPRGATVFVSSNGWDAGCAAAYGFTTLWVNRAGDPVDRLPGRPHHIARDLTALPGVV